MNKKFMGNEMHVFAFSFIFNKYNSTIALVVSTSSDWPKRDWIKMYKTVGFLKNKVWIG